MGRPDLLSQIHLPAKHLLGMHSPDTAAKDCLEHGMSTMVASCRGPCLNNEPN